MCVLNRVKSWSKIINKEMKSISMKQLGSIVAVADIFRRDQMLLDINHFAVYTEDLHGRALLIIYLFMVLLSMSMASRHSPSKPYRGIISVQRIVLSLTTIFISSFRMIVVIIFFMGRLYCVCAVFVACRDHCSMCLKSVTRSSLPIVLLIRRLRK